MLTVLWWLLPGSEHTHVGTCREKRDWPAASTWFSSPEMLAAMSGLMQQGRYKKPLDFLANDMWSLGCLLGWMLSEQYPFGIDDPADWQDPANHTPEGEIAYVVSRQIEWVSVLCHWCRLLVQA